MHAKKMAAGFFLNAIVLAAVIQVCKPMQMICGSACTGGTAISAMAMEGRGAMDMNAQCTEKNGGCSAAKGDTSHMATFSSVFPSMSTSPFHLTLFAAVLFAVALWLSPGSTYDTSESVRMSRLKSHIRKVADALRANILRFILSQGILQPKIYA